MQESRIRRIEAGCKTGIRRFGQAAFFLGLFVFQSASAAPGQKLCVKKEYLTSGLEVKEAPSKTANTVMVIGAGRVIVEFDRKDGWVFGGVERAGGVTGYVPQEAVDDSDLDGLPCGS